MARMLLSTAMMVVTVDAWYAQIPDEPSSGLVLLQQRAELHSNAHNESEQDDEARPYFDEEEEDAEEEPGSQSRSCIGDMCMPYAPDAVNQSLIGTLEGSEHEAKFDKPMGPAICSRIPLKGTKYMLMPTVHAYHGSTALETVLMSSPHLTSLCSANTWQCEGYRIWNKKNSKTGAENPFLMHNWLERFSRFWDLDKSVFLEKGPRDANKIEVEMGELQAEIKKGLPPLMVKHGINKLKFVYIVMWRPICLGQLSHAKGKDSNAKPIHTHAQKVKVAREELHILEDQVNVHRQLIHNGQDALVLNLADMLWRSSHVKMRLQTLMPCLGTLDFDKLPKLHKDIFEDNKFKADVSVKQFGLQYQPFECCKYAVQSKTCMGDGDLFRHLPAAEVSRARKAVEYLINHSG